MRASKRLCKKTALLFLIIIIFGIMTSISMPSGAATSKPEIKNEDINNKILLASEWLFNQQRSDGSWPMVTQDKKSSVVATGLFSLVTYKIISEYDKSDTKKYEIDIEKVISFLLSHQHDEGYWEATSSFPWNKTEVTTAALFGLVSVDYKGRALEKGMCWLLNQQKINGSWNDDCWDTSWAIYLFSYSDYPHSDRIIKTACQWLANNQREDGSWKTNLSNLKRFEPLWTTPPSIFALAQTGQYHNAMSKGLKYLEKKQNKNGSFGHWDASKTGLALMAFSSLSEYPELMNDYILSSEKSVQWFIKNQRRKGTWPGGFHPFNIVDTAFSIWGLTHFIK